MVGVGLGVDMVARGGLQSVRDLVDLSERRGLRNFVWVQSYMSFGRLL